MKSKFKRILSGILSVAVTISAVPIVSANAEESTEPYPYTLFAASSAEGAINIEASNICINGNIATNGTIESSGNFNVNGTKKENANEPMIIIFDKINNQYFMDVNVDEFEDNYNIEETNINITTSTEVLGEASLTGNITISAAFKALDDISFSGDVENTDNSVIFSQFGNINIDSQNISLNGLVYAPNGCVDISAQNLNMNSVVIIADSISISCPNLNANYSRSMAEFVGITSESKSDFENFIVLSGEYNEYDETIDMMWFTNVAADHYDIYCSDNDENYELIDSTDDNSYQYDIEDDFDTKYFKVTVTDENDSIVESDAFCVTASDEGYLITYIDSDDDGLQDSVEKIYGTDPDNPDTDGDNLTDGFEVLKSHTNPTIPDTDNNGITDDLEDPDEDGLNNYEEMLHETDPHTADTEGDGLNDGDEVNVYRTDPLNPDTDNDGIIDADEVNFKLDPNDSTDFDTPVHQVLNSEDLRVNRYNSDFSISMDVEASNNVKRYIKQESSRYSSILSENRAIIGRPINLKYEAGTIFNGTIKFTLSEKLVNETPSYYPNLDIGIERYGLFIYDEEIGTIVPVSCEYNSDDNSFTVDANVMGNLMIIDYEALLYDLGIAPDDVKAAIESYGEDFEYDDEDEEDIEDDSDDDDDTSIVSETKFATKSLLLNSPKILSDEPTSSNSGPRQIELVLVIDTTGSMGSQISTVKRNLNDLITKLYNDGITQYTAVITYGDIDYNEKTLLNNEENPTVQFYNNPTSIQSVINNITMCNGGDDLETAIDGLGLAESLRYSDNRSKYLFLITDIGSKTKNNYGFANMEDIASALYNKGIYASIVTSESKFSAYKDLTNITGGTEIPQNGNFCDDMYEFIVRSTPRVSVIVANNLVTGCFKEDLVKGGSCDTDEDGLSDSDEINWKYIKIKDGKNIYPKWSELCKKSAYKGSKNSKFYKALKDIKIIPANTNPFSKDTDGDGYLDGEDDDPLKKNAWIINDAEIDDMEYQNKGKTLSYERSPYDTHHFTLTPLYDSYYRFKTDASRTSTIYITHEKGWGLGKETIYDSSLQDGSYLLRKGIEYNIEVWGINSGDYTFSVAQDNWIYSEYGGARSITYTPLAGALIDHDYFISDRALHQIIDNYCQIKLKNDPMTYGEFLEKRNYDTGEMNDSNVYYNNCKLYVYYLDECFGVGNEYADEILSDIGNAASLASVIFIIEFPYSTEIGALVTCIGASTAICSMLGEDEHEQLARAIYEGKGNFCIKNSINNSNFNPLRNTNDIYYSSWTTDNYIRRTCHEGVYKFEKFEMHKIRELSDGTLELVI